MSEVASGLTPSDPPPVHEYLQGLYPDFEPGAYPPPLFTLNGFGLTLYGSRDFDQPTVTYVKTLCLVVLFVPILALGAYRVTDCGNNDWPFGDREWLFTGTHRLSLVAKGWNALLISAVLALIGSLGYVSWSDSPERKAQLTVAEADALRAEGEVLRAVQTYCSLGDTPERERGREALIAILREEAGQAPPADVALWVQVISNSSYSSVISDATADLLERLTEVTNDHPRGALKLLDAMGEVDAQVVEQNEGPVLVACNLREPEDPEIASRLAGHLEKRNELQRAEAVLRAVPQDALKGTEGARILGQILAAQGETELAEALLMPYVEGRLRKLRKAVERVLRAQDEVRSLALKQLDRNKNFQVRYDKATPSKQQQMVEEYLNRRYKKSKKVEKALKELRKVNAVVPVALDLGIVKLRRAQATSDPEQRQALLQEAEVIFISIKEVAGQSSEYQLNLAQVSYWLGKSDQGRQLFEQALAAGDRKPALLLRVAFLMRELGLHEQAVALSEEAYGKAKASAQKQEVAEFRALLANDLDEIILWYERADTKALRVRASLSGARGQKAWADGRLEEAGRLLRQATKQYDGLPESAANLNNAALTHYSLYLVSGRPEQFESYTHKLQRAEGLQHGDPILMGNVASALIQRATLEVIGDRLVYKALRMAPESFLLYFLWDDPTERDRVRAAFTKRVKALGVPGRLAKLSIIAPRSTVPYQARLTLLEFSRDVEALRALSRAVKEADLVSSAQVTESLSLLQRQAEPDEVKSWRKLVRHRRRRLERARRLDHPRTVALALTLLIHSQLLGVYMGQTVDPEPLVKQAREAVRLSPSVGTKATFMRALMWRATRRLSDSLPAFAAAQRRAQRSMDPSSLIRFTLTHGSPALASAAAREPDVREVAALVARECERDPASMTPADWALLKRLDPKAAAHVAEHVRQNERGRLFRQIRQLLNPVDTRIILSRVWVAEIEGHPDEAQRILKSAASQGVPLPWAIE